MNEHEEREVLIEQYADGFARLEQALAHVPRAALAWRPEALEWSVHEIVCHCADSETNAASRIRYLAAEEDLRLEGYDPDRWAATFDYHTHPLDLALKTVEAVRANTAALIRRLPAGAWEREAAHKTKGRYSASDWLRTYATHLHEHSAQIERNVEAWHKAQGGAERYLSPR